MKKFTFLVIAMMLSFGALMADDFDNGNFRFRTGGVGGGVLVMGPSAAFPGGAFDIPSTATYNSVTYNVTELRNYFISKFDDDKRATSVAVPEGVVNIGVGSGGSFDASGTIKGGLLTSITLPSTITTATFTNFSFNSLPALTDFTIKCTTPPIIESGNTFYEIPGPLTIHIPAGTLSAYQNAGWSNVLHATLVEDPAPPVVQTTVPTIDFETVGNTWSWGVFGNGINATDDPANMVVPFANPSATGINSSANCAKFINDATATVWGGCQSVGIGTFILNDQNCIVKMMVYKDVISDCMLKFAGDEGDVAIMVPNTKINEWEELTFDFSAKIGTTYKNIQLVPDHPVTRTAGSTSYFDNISFNPIPPVVQTTVPTVDFETVGNTWSWGVFGNGINATDDPANMVVPFANPSATGINSSANCAKFIDDATATVWGGCQSEGIGTFILNDQNCIVKMMVYKDVISDCMLKFAGDEGDVAIMVPNTKINEWEELTFDFSAKIGTTYKNIQLVPDHPATRTAGSTSYFDNISFNPAPPVVQTTVPTVDFETVGNTWSWGVFGNGAGGVDEPANMVVPFANPSATGINSSANCAKFIDDATATVWGGCQSESIGTFILNDQNCIVKMMVYKDVISDCMLKFAGDEGDVAIMVPNTKINEWEELTFDFSAKIGTTYKNIQLVPDHPATRTVGSTSYFDNISFNPVVLPVGTNIAKGLIATTNCTNVLQGTGGLVTDEGTWTSDSRWRLELASALPDPAHAYVALDFGADQVIDSVVINAGWSGDNGLTGDAQITDFKLQSFDGTNWNDIPGVSVSGNSLLIIPFYFSPALTTSQIRMDITAVSEPSSEGQIKLYEFKVYGTPAIPTKISSVKAAKGLSTYPNPVKDQMQVNLSGTAHQGGIIEIINLTGKVLKTQQVDGAGTVSVNMSQLSKGLYFCRYTNGTEIRVAKIVKQ